MRRGGGRVVSLTKYEHETVVSMNDAETVAYVYTAQTRVLNRLRRHPAARLVEEGEHEGSVWARFEVPAKLVAFRTPVAPMTEEQRAVAAERLARVRREGALSGSAPSGLRPGAEAAEQGRPGTSRQPQPSEAAEARTGPSGDGAR